MSVPSDEMARSRSLPLIVRAAGPELVMVIRVTGGGADARHGAHTVSHAIANMSAAAAHDHVRARAQAERDAAPGRAVAPSIADGAVNASSISSRASAAESSRRLRSFSRQRQSSRRIAVGVAAGSVRQFGSVFSTDANVSKIVSPVNSRWPVNISKTITPNAQTSARLSAACPLACSGAMYAAVPRITP